MKHLEFSALFLFIFLITLVPGHVGASDTHSFHESLIKLDTVLGALDAYTDDHRVSPGDSMTYGKLIKSGELPQDFCKTSIEKEVCGGASLNKEYQHAKGPPLKLLDSFGVIRIILPFWNPEGKHFRKINLVLRGHPTLVARAHYKGGYIPVVLYETRPGALERFIRKLKSNNSEPHSTLKQGLKL
ncbi:MAG: hypothetical protein ABEK50_01460 [bacterium]